MNAEHLRADVHVKHPFHLTRIRELQKMLCKCLQTLIANGVEGILHHRMCIYVYTQGGFACAMYVYICIFLECSIIIFVKYTNLHF